METIDLTPTWRGLLPALLELVRSDDAEVRLTARTELFRMAQAADAYNRIAQSNGLMDMSLITDEGLRP